METNERVVKLAAAFLMIANRYNAPGWIEYLLWETVEGVRDRPFKLLDPLTPEEMLVLQELRDEVKIWFVWMKRWEYLPIDKWREHARGTTADDVRYRMEQI